MDTKFWGPSGWDLLHLITFEKGNLSKKKQLFSTLPYILPCKFCRESSHEFLEQEPLTNNLALWLYEFHNKVNNKLLLQGLHPQKAPSFIEVMKLYKDRLKNLDNLVGVDFLLSIAFNYNDKVHSKSNHELFWLTLKDLYPNYDLSKYPTPRITKEHYFKDVYNILNNLGYNKSYSETYNHIKKFKSGCSKNKFRGKTCRKKKPKKL
jgi:hypothetical protein